MRLTFSPSGRRHRPGTIAALAAGLLLVAPLAVRAQEARAAKWVNLRAGPARDYPLVAQLSPGTPLAVQGCTNGFGWCDVIGPGGARGWVYAGNLNYAYQGAEVPVIGYGAAIGLPIIGFTIGSYWGSYYRERPWYGNWHRYEHHRPPPRPVFAPPGRPPMPGRPPGFRPPFDHRPHGDGRPPGIDRPTGGGHRPEMGRPGGGGGRPEMGRPGGRHEGGGGHRGGGGGGPGRGH